jgi:hypothetical protein
LISTHCFVFVKLLLLRRDLLLLWMLCLGLFVFLFGLRRVLILLPTFLLDTGQAPAEAGVVDTPAGRAGAAADILAGTAVVVDLPAAQP